MYKNIFIFIVASIFLWGCNANKKADSANSTNTVNVNTSLSYAKVIDKNQVIRSLYSVAGITPNPTDSITPPTLASDTNKLSSLTSPMILALGSTASDFCDILRLREESAVGGVDNKKFLKLLLSSTTSNNSYLYVESVPEAVFTQTVEIFAQKFWGRLPTTEELTVLKEEAFNVYQPATETTTSARRNMTRRLGMFVCVSMLGSFQTITY